MLSGGSSSGPVSLPACTHGAVCCRCLLIWSSTHPVLCLSDSRVYLVRPVLLPLFLHLSLEACCRYQAEPLAGWTFDRDRGYKFLVVQGSSGHILSVLFWAGGSDGSHHCTLASSGYKSMWYLYFKNFPCLLCPHNHHNNPFSNSLVRKVDTCLGSEGRVP